MRLYWNLSCWCREGDLNPHNPFGPADSKSQNVINEGRTFVAVSAA
jgi:hypothetical protein